MCLLANSTDFGVFPTEMTNLGFDPGMVKQDEMASLGVKILSPQRETSVTLLFNLNTLGVCPRLRASMRLCSKRAMTADLCIIIGDELLDT
jgi:hypothetical protein